VLGGAHPPSILVSREKRPLQKAGVTKSPMVGSCARWRGPGPDVLNNLPTAVWLASEDDNVAAFGSDFSACGYGGQAFLKVAAVVGEIAGGFEVLAVEREVAVKCGHYGLEKGAERGGPSDAFAGGLQEDGVWCIELQDRFELFGVKILDPGFANFGEGYDSRGLRSGGGRKTRCEDGSERQERYGCAARAWGKRRFVGACGRDVHGGSYLLK